MKIQIKGTNLDLTPSIKEYIENKISGLEKFIKSIEIGTEAIARVEIGRTTRHHVKGDVFRAEVNIDLTQNIARAEHTDADVRTSIDMVYGKLKNILSKQKDKRQETR